MHIPSYHRLEGPYLRLQGQRCAACASFQFPPRRSCRNCHKVGKLSPYVFCGQGKVASFSELTQAPNGFDGPLIIALVTLDEGVTVATQLTDVEVENIQIGMPVEMVTRRLRELGPEGCLVYGYKFRPVIA
jgi:uncharacterized OB-fold protein